MPRSCGHGGCARPGTSMRRVVGSSHTPSRQRGSSSRPRRPTSGRSAWRVSASSRISRPTPPPSDERGGGGRTVTMAAWVGWVVVGTGALVAGAVLVLLWQLRAAVGRRDDRDALVLLQQQLDAL